MSPEGEHHVITALTSLVTSQLDAVRADIAAGRRDAASAHDRLGEQIGRLDTRVGQLERDEAEEHAIQRERRYVWTRVGIAAGCGAFIADVLLRLL